MGLYCKYHADKRARARQCRRLWAAGRVVSDCNRAGLRSFRSGVEGYGDRAAPSRGETDSTTVRLAEGSSYRDVDRDRGGAPVGDSHRLSLTGGGNNLNREDQAAGKQHDTAAHAGQSDGLRTVRGIIRNRHCCCPAAAQRRLENHPDGATRSGGERFPATGGWMKVAAVASRYGDAADGKSRIAAIRKGDNLGITARPNRLRRETETLGPRRVSQCQFYSEGVVRPAAHLGLNAAGRNWKIDRTGSSGDVRVSGNVYRNAKPGLGLAATYIRGVNE